MVEIIGPGKLSLGENSRVLGNGKLLVSRVNASTPSNTDIVLLGGRILHIDTKHYFPDNTLNSSFIYTPDYKYETRVIGPGEYIRIKAVQDIPELGIRAGDLGGKIYNPKDTPVSVNMYISGKSWMAPDVVIEVAAHRLNKISLVDSIILPGSQLNSSWIYLNNSIFQGKITTYFAGPKIYIEGSTIISGEVTGLLGQGICILDSIVINEELTLADSGLLYGSVKSAQNCIQCLIYEQNN